MAINGEVREFARRIQETAAYATSSEEPGGGIDGLFDGASTVEIKAALDAVDFLIGLPATGPLGDMLSAAISDGNLSTEVTELQVKFQALSLVG